MRSASAELCYAMLTRLTVRNFNALRGAGGGVGQSGRLHRPEQLGQDLVTAGAGPLFGSSISEALAEAGARVITASRSLERNQEYAAALARQTGAEVHGMELDIGDAAAIERFHAEVIDRFGNVEILVNSALVRDATAGSFETQTIDAWQRSAAGDMVGLYAICKAFIGSMVAAGRGSIISISSIYGVVGNDPSLYEDTEMVQPPNYNFIKAGMINFTRYVANYYGRKGVRANCISPGGYYTGRPARSWSATTSGCRWGA